MRSVSPTMRTGAVAPPNAAACGSPGSPIAGSGARRDDRQWQRGVEYVDGRRERRATRDSLRVRRRQCVDEDPQAVLRCREHGQPRIAADLVAPAAAIGEVLLAHHRRLRTPLAQCVQALARTPAAAARSPSRRRPASRPGPARRAGMAPPAHSPTRWRCSRAGRDAVGPTPPWPGNRWRRRAVTATWTGEAFRRRCRPPDSTSRPVGAPDRSCAPRRERQAAVPARRWPSLARRPDRRRGAAGT